MCSSLVTLFIFIDYGIHFGDSCQYFRDKMKWQSHRVIYILFLTSRFAGLVWKGFKYHSTFKRLIEKSFKQVKLNKKKLVFVLLQWDKWKKLYECSNVKNAFLQLTSKISDGIF